MRADTEPAPTRGHVDVVRATAYRAGEEYVYGAYDIVNLDDAIAYALDVADHLAAARAAAIAYVATLALRIEGLIAVGLACGRAARRRVADARRRLLQELDAFTTCVNRTGPPVAEVG